MEKNLYIDASHPDETRIVLKSENHIEEYEYENKNKLNLKNNIYLGKVSRIEPSLQAAFVNYGKQRHGFLAFNDIQSDYYQIPHDDKDRLQKEEENFDIVIVNKGIPKDIKQVTIKNRIKLVDFLLVYDLVSSKGEAKRLIKQSAVKINDDVVLDLHLNLEVSTIYTIKVGKRRFIKII